MPDEPPMTEGIVRYEGMPDIAVRAGITRARLHEILEGPWIPDPDVRLGRRLGWHPDRSGRWLAETGRIDIHGRPAVASRQGSPAKDEEPPAWYRKIPERYLTLGQVAYLLVTQRQTIADLKTRGAGPRPAIAIGAQLGYTLDEAITTGLQWGRIEEKDVAWVHERYRTGLGFS